MTVTSATLSRLLTRLSAAALLAAAALAGAGAQELTSAGGHDANQPIEINADRLEVQQDQSLAVFSGNVVAAQGAMRLHAQTLKVFYSRAQEGGANAEATISRIDAIGEVFLASPKETAQGATGVYDVANRMITLSGSVVLTRGDNVIRGDRLVLDLTSGRSRVEGGSAGGQQQRVRALFVPPAKPAQE